MKKNVHPDVLPYQYAFAMAEGFYKVGIAEAKSMPPTSTTPIEDLMSSVCPAAVNLAFSLELYLKTIFMLTNNKAKTGHELWEIFVALPASMQQHLKDDYARGYAREAQELRGMYINTFISNEEEPTPIVDFSSSKDLETLLKEHNMMFVEFRYMYEPIVGGYEYRVDFNPLNIGCKIMQHLIKQMIEASKNPGVTTQLLALYQREE